MDPAPEEKRPKTEARGRATGHDLVGRRADLFSATGHLGAIGASAAAGYALPKDEDEMAGARLTRAASHEERWHPSSVLERGAGLHGEVYSISGGQSSMT